jgi:hypothetical protein
MVGWLLEFVVKERYTHLHIAFKCITKLTFNVQMWERPKSNKNLSLWNWRIGYP